MATSKYLLVAAIDFGTTYSGYAYSTKTDFQREPSKAYIKQWVDPASSMMYNKTSTCILLDKYKIFSKFGFEAEAKYLDLTMDKEDEAWYFFRRFKMILYNKQSSGDDLYVVDESGKQLPALIVFSESLKYLKQSLLEEAKKQQTDIRIDDIKWILTVPAIWSDPAKAFMRTAAIEAGIDSDKLTIALEPEAAAIYVKHLPVERRLDGEAGDVFKTFAPGSKYIVVDAGGGTIDITAHEVFNDGTVRELIKANGGNWGGTSVDREYIEFIKCLTGNLVVQSIQKSSPHIFFEICRDFENAKRTIKPQSDLKFNVRIPSQLGETYAKIFSGKDLKSKDVISTNYNKQIRISFLGDKLRLASKDAEDFFSESLKNITRHLKGLLRRKYGIGVTTIILVGGYAESPMLVQGIKSTFPDMKIIIPQEAAWSVLRGAVIFGHDPSLIKERRSKYTYGIRTSQPFDPSKHDEKYKYEADREIRCSKLFSILIKIDELVTIGEYQKKKSYFMPEIGKSGNFSLYASTSANPKYVDEKGCSFVGYILSPGHSFLLKETIEVMMCFGETEIKINARQPKSGKSKIYYFGH